MTTEVLFKAAIVLLVSFSCIQAFAANVAEPGETKVMQWKDGKRAVFFLAFDDSCVSHLTNAIPELEKRNLVGTFYINAGNPPYLSRQVDWLKAAKSPAVVIGNHTFTHKGVQNVEQVIEQVDQANAVIREITPGKWPRVVSFARPGGVKWEVTAEQTAPIYAERNLFQRPPFYGPPGVLKTTEEMLAYVKKTIDSGTMGHADFHGVGGDWLVVEMPTYIALLDELVKQRDVLWVTDHATYVRYTKQRDAAQVEVLSKTPAEIKLSLKWDLDANLYDTPLTLRTQVPADWSQCSVKQGEHEQRVPVRDGAVLFDAVQGEITLRRI